MQYEILKKLKSGTDVRGTAIGENMTLTNEAVEIIAKAFAKWLSGRINKKNVNIAIGGDCRISTARILKTVKCALISSGVKVYDCGICTTPSMFMILKDAKYQLDGSVMITASHLPYDRNGLKFFTPDGGLESKNIDEILRIAADGDFFEGNGKDVSAPYMDEYCNGLLKVVRTACGNDKPLTGKKVIVDAGNGCGGFFVDKILKPLGADTEGSQFLSPDGRFLNHIPNPEDKNAIASLSQAVKAHNADLGIIFDTDVDRAGAVDSDGKEINRNRLIALLATVLFKEKRGVIVTDSVTSQSLSEYIKNLGGEHLRFKRGYKNVIDKCVELNGAGTYSPLAIETSGHAAFKDNYYLDDGAYLVTRILILLSTQAKGEKLCSLISELKDPVEESEIRLSFTSDSVDFKAEGDKVIEDLTLIASKDENLRLAQDNYEGVRIFFDGLQGNVIVRMSVHDPIMPINIESYQSGGVKKIAQSLYEILKGYAFLNTENLKNIT